MANLLNEAEIYVRELLQAGLQPDHFYHNLPHTQLVVDATRLLTVRHNLPAADAEALELAAWFHDTGFTQQYEQNEPLGAAIAADFLASKGYPADRIELVKRVILATTVAHSPVDVLEKIIKDADLSNIGRADYLAILSGLRHEWEVFREEKYSDTDWYQLNYDFLKSHQYHTAIAQETYGLQHKQNTKTLKKLCQAKQPAQKPAVSIAESKSAQMMFKTALRNHMDLSNLADNKANIMLSVNALIITIAVPMAASYVNTKPHLMAPVIILLLTCLCSMIFATLATRPMAMTGYTKKEDVKAGRANLFFFGNFYRMGLQEYEEGIDLAIAKNSNLDAAIKRDLFFLGKSLGRKYDQLRICYNLFISGVVLSILLFGISYAVFE
ncbi:MAG: DUF5706 domain-containing protein [Saprospiraceae bacterium]